MSDVRIPFDNKITVDEGLYSALYISMFGTESWWGNLLGDKIESNVLRVLRENSLSSATLTKIEDAVRRDITWLNLEVEIFVSIPQLNRVLIEINGLEFTIDEDKTELIIPDPPSPSPPIWLFVEEITV